LDSVEDVDRGLSERVLKILDLFKEALAEFDVDNLAIDSHHVTFGRYCVSDAVEARQETVGDDLTTTAGRAHGSDKLEVFDVVEDDLFSVVPGLVVDPLSQEFKRRLGSESVSSWHVKVINVSNNLGLGILWFILALGLSIEVTLDDFLSSIGAGTS
jgi:hypothetical protein